METNLETKMEKPLLLKSYFLSYLLTFEEILVDVNSCRLYSSFPEFIILVIENMQNLVHLLKNEEE